MLTKDITIGGQRYQLNPMTPEAASRIFNLLVATNMNLLKGTPKADQAKEKALWEMTVAERTESAAESVWLLGASSLPEKEYSRVQHVALRAVKAYDAQGNTSVILMTDGSWATKGMTVDLSQDAALVKQLIAESLKFNLAPLFLAAETRKRPVAQ
jgi:hypothetical protein